MLAVFRSLAAFDRATYRMSGGLGLLETVEYTILSAEDMHTYFQDIVGDSPCPLDQLIPALVGRQVYKARRESDVVLPRPRPRTQLWNGPS